VKGLRVLHSERREVFCLDGEVWGESRIPQAESDFTPAAFHHYLCLSFGVHSNPPCWIPSGSESAKLECPGHLPHTNESPRTALAAYIFLVIPSTGAHGPYGLFLVAIISGERCALDGVRKICLRSQPCTA
jgi:hypothetical protein